MVLSSLNMAPKRIPSCFLVLGLISFLTVSVSAGRSNWQETLKTIQEVNSEGPYLGLITVYPPEEEAFNASNAFTYDSDHPYVDMSGRRFRIGTINGTKIIYVRCGVGMVNAAAATQQMADLFNITGIIHFGIAGNLNSSLSYGDVTILRRVANTAIFDWLNPNGTTSHTHIIPDYLVFGEFNVPEGNETSNSLGRIGFRYEKYLSESAEPNTNVETAWFNSTDSWFEVATKLEGLELDQTYNGTTLPTVPKLVIGLNGSTADIFLDNKAYRNFIYKEFNASSHDMESSAIVMTSSSNGFPVIVIRGLSDVAGGESGNTNEITEYGEIAAHNTVKVVLEYIYYLCKGTNYY